MGLEQPIVDMAPPQPHRLTVEEFLTLDEAGAFEGFAKAELIEGEIFTVNAIHRPHAGVHAALILGLGNAIERAGLSFRIYAPVSARLDDHSLPEPDIAVATVEDEDFVTPGSIRLAVEVASSSLAFDLGRKAALYARTGVPEYWVVDVRGRVVHRMAEPGEDGYAVKAVIAFGERLEAATLPGIAIATDALD